MAIAKAETIPEYALTVAHAALVKALKTAIFGIKKKTTGNFTIIHAAGQLILRGPVGEAILPAEGYWPIHVSISPLLAKNLVNALPDTDPVHLKFKEGRLYIEKFSVPAQQS